VCVRVDSAQIPSVRIEQNDQNVPAQLLAAETVQISQQSHVRGRSAAFRTALGVFSADLFWVAASVVGLTAVIVASQPVFQAIKVLPAICLCWLGATLILRRRKSAAAPSQQDSEPRRLRLSPFAEGAMCDLFNPKTLLVFTSVIPQFVPTDAGHPAQAAVLGVTFATLGLLSLLTYALVFGRIGLAGLESRLGDAILLVIGAVLAVFGIRLAVEPTD
jgi:threonine/homoserine/homoserine lactone efflux protein